MRVELVNRGGDKTKKLRDISKIKIFRGALILELTADLEHVPDEGTWIVKDGVGEMVVDIEDMMLVQILGDDSTEDDLG